MTLFLTIVAAVIVGNLLLAFLVVNAREIGIVLLCLFGGAAFLVLYALGFFWQTVGCLAIVALLFALWVTSLPKPYKTRAGQSSQKATPAAPAPRRSAGT